MRKQNNTFYVRSKNRFRRASLQPTGQKDTMVESYSIPPENLKEIDQITHGSFGNVSKGKFSDYSKLTFSSSLFNEKISYFATFINNFQGLLRTNGKCQKVAIKKSPTANECDDRYKLLVQEYSIIKCLQNENIVQFLVS